VDTLNTVNKKIIKIKKIRFKSKKHIFFDFFKKIMISINPGRKCHAAIPSLEKRKK